MTFYMFEEIISMLPFYENKEQDFLYFSSKNLTFPAHLHSACELLFVMEGSLLVTIQDESRILEKNCAALIFPDTIHSYETMDNECLVFLCIFNPASVKDYYHLFRKFRPDNPFLPSTQIHPDVSLGIQRILETGLEETSHCIAWLHVILSYLLPAFELVVRKNRENTDITYQVIQYISLHFQEPLTLEHMAKELHFNKSYISRIFSGKLNCGFYDYVNQIRLDYVSHAIRTSDKTLTVLWQEAGFESQRTFNRVFKKVYGMTPTQYRKQLTHSLHESPHPSEYSSDIYHQD